MDLPQEPEELLRADFVGDLRLAFGTRLPRVGIALGALLEGGVLLRTSSNDLQFATRQFATRQFATRQFATGHFATGRATFARMVCSAFGLLAATGGLAVAGALPAPVQHAVSGAAETIGFELPDGGFDLPFGAPPLTTAATSTPPETTADQRERTPSRALESVGPLLPDALIVPTTTQAVLPESAGTTPTSTTADDKPHITIGGVWALPSVPTPTTEPSTPPATPPSPSSSTTTSSSTTSTTVAADDSTTTTTATTIPIAPDAGLDP